MTDTTPAIAGLEDAERAVVKWVSEVLEEPSASTEDNFLDLGGHSMLALELNERVQEHFAVDVDMRTLFEQNLAEVAADLLTRSRATDQNGAEA